MRQPPQTRPPPPELPEFPPSGPVLAVRGRWHVAPNVTKQGGGWNGGARDRAELQRTPGDRAASGPWSDVTHPAFARDGCLGPDPDPSDRASDRAGPDRRTGNPRRRRPGQALDPDRDQP